MAAPPATICPPGYMCPAMSGYPIGCPNGMYQDQQQKAFCHPCPAGHYCNNNASMAIVCPQGSYCPANNSYPYACPDGTYGAAAGLSNYTECTICPPGKYCIGGNIAGNCSAGYFCRIGSSSPTPSGIYTVVGGLCQAGSYCPAGTTAPIQCPDGTVRLSLGGTVISDCTTCPAGYQCMAGDPIPVLCSVGSYCPVNATMQSCPAGTYNPVAGASNSSSCLSCPAGYLCSASGQSTFTTTVCPAGYYCTAGVALPIPCPGSTYQPTPGRTSVTQCLTCPQGFYCENATVTPQPCPGGNYCPQGYAIPIACPAGYYCSPQSAAPVICPGNFYCPANSNQTIPCPNGYYCPIGSVNPQLCPLGTYYNPTSADLSTDAVCTRCPAGTHGTHPQRLSCLACTPGYVCTGGTNSATPTNATLEGGYVCPIGHYCPLSSAIETPCPIGRFNNLTGGSHLDNCTLCPANSFQSLTGQSACYPCGGNSYSSPGAGICLSGHLPAPATDGSCMCRGNGHTDELRCWESTHGTAHLSFMSARSAQLAQFAVPRNTLTNDHCATASLAVRHPGPVLVFVSARTPRTKGEVCDRLSFQPGSLLFATAC